MRIIISSIFFFWLIAYSLSYEVRVFSSLLVSPWASGVSFWKPGFFIFWISLGLLKQSGGKQLSPLIFFSFISSLLITIYPFIELDQFILSKLLSFNDLKVSVHSLLHSHTVKLPLGYLRDLLGISVFADSGEPWRPYVPLWIVLFHGVGTVCGLISILRLSLKCPKSLLGSFGVVLAYFDGGPLAPYAIAGLILLLFPNRVMTLASIMFPASFFIEWAQSFCLYLFFSLLISEKRFILNLLFIIPIIIDKGAWVLKPFSKIPANSEIVQIDRNTKSVIHKILEDSTSYMDIMRPYPPLWNLVEVDGLSCDKNSGFSSNLKLLRPKNVTGSLSTNFSNMNILDGSINIAHKGCTPNTYEIGTVLSLNQMGIKSGVLILSN